jgi:hypothetical protein
MNRSVKLYGVYNELLEKYLVGSVFIHTQYIVRYKITKLDIKNDTFEYSSSYSDDTSFTPGVFNLSISRFIHRIFLGHIKRLPKTNDE